MANFFLHVVNMSITASYLIVAVIVLRLILNKAPKWIRGILWGLVGIRLVIPFSFESMFSLIPAKSSIPAINHFQEITNPNGSNLSQIWWGNTGVSTTSPNMDIAEKITPVMESPQAEAFSIISILTIVWLIGVAVMLVYCITSYICLNKRVADAVIYRNEKHVIYQSEKVTSPFVLGLFKPRIYLPYHMEQTDMDCVIAHEKAHISRLDHWIKPFAYAILAFYWFNPFIWLAYILLCHDIELACDEKVISEMGIAIKKQYSESLFKCSVPKHIIAACPLAFGEVDVKKRIVNVLHYKKPTLWIILVSLVSCAIVALCFLTNPNEKIPEKTQTELSETPNVSKSPLEEQAVSGNNLQQHILIQEEIQALSERKTELQANLEYEQEVLTLLEKENAEKQRLQEQKAVVNALIKEMTAIQSLLDEMVEMQNNLEQNQVKPSATQPEIMTPSQIAYAPPIMTLQDALSSTLNYIPVESNNYEWSYNTDNSSEKETVIACGDFPTIAVKGKEEEWIQVKNYNGIDYAPYILNFDIKPNRIQICEYDLLELGDMKPKILSEQILEDIYLLELKPRRIYEINAVWDEGSNEAFHGQASYIFATDNYAVSDTETDAKNQAVIIHATIKDIMNDTTDKICISSDSEDYPGAFVVSIPTNIYSKDTLQGGQQIILSMYDTGKMYDEHLPLYEALNLYNP